MRRAAATRILSPMAAEQSSGFTVHEFRLPADVDQATMQGHLDDLDGDAPSVPLLVRINDAQAFASVRTRSSGDAVAEGDIRTAIDALGLARRSRDFRTRVAVAPPEAGRHFRLAITEFGRNDAAASAPDTWVAAPDGGQPDADSQLLWIGGTSESTQGLFVLVGHAAETPASPNDGTAVWPLPLSDDLGVRIYTGTRV